MRTAVGRHSSACTQRGEGEEEEEEEEEEKGEGD